MLERTQVYVDTSYLLASFYNSWATGARAQLEIDLPAVVATLGGMIEEQLGQPIQRQLWYDGIPDSGPHRYQRALRTCDGVQLRAGQLIEWGERRTQKAVDTRLVADMVVAGLRRQCSDIVLVSGDADMIPGVQEATAAGIRVHLYGFGWDSMSSALRHACDSTMILDPREDFRDCMQLQVLEGPLPPNIPTKPIGDAEPIDEVGPTSVPSLVPKPDKKDEQSDADSCEADTTSEELSNSGSGEQSQAQDIAPDAVENSANPSDTSDANNQAAASEGPAAAAATDPGVAGESEKEEGDNGENTASPAAPQTPTPPSPATLAAQQPTGPAAAGAQAADAAAARPKPAPTPATAASRSMSVTAQQTRLSVRADSNGIRAEEETVVERISVSRGEPTMPGKPDQPVNSPSARDSISQDTKHEQERHLAMNDSENTRPDAVADDERETQPAPKKPAPSPSMMAPRRKLRSRYVPLPNEVWASAGFQTPYDVGQQYATWWYTNAATAEQRDNAHLLCGGGLPPEVDRPLLQFACETLHEYTLNESQRVALRDGFHSGIRAVLLHRDSN
ncbi:NYN domain-containing protein [Corynebacterium aquilae]|uniref:NYN domain-containing protein n=1 Tax=Corynebacterium aquilae DSM 44791 TaxID=1431546 RepID=A0A1L7CIU6_9CORY|nr:NYN domain-containing protein [Corynebacterium aquilae]APT85703.1 hypothetical protein CAQU_12405 [Corynebacterium aquilae DSM 44791]